MVPLTGHDFRLVADVPGNVNGVVRHSCTMLTC